MCDYLSDISRRRKQCRCSIVAFGQSVSDPLDFYGFRAIFYASYFEFASSLSDNRGQPKMDSPNSSLYPTNNDSAARERLISLRLTLLKIHKTLLDMERREYEREHGYVNSGELFRLVVDHAQFAWLHNISEFVVRIDETLAAKEPVTPEYTRVAYSLARKMFVPTESGDAFQKKYFDAIQRDPAVVIEHAELARLFSNEPPDSPVP